MRGCGAEALALPFSTNGMILSLRGFAAVLVAWSCHQMLSADADDCVDLACCVEGGVHPERSQVLVRPVTVRSFSTLVRGRSWPHPPRSESV